MFPWTHLARGRVGVETGMDAAVFAGTVQIYTDLGGSGASVADARISTQVGGTWDGTDTQLTGLSWVFMELLSFEDGPDWGGRLPEIQFVVRSGISDNPAEVAEWLLTERCDKVRR